MYGRIAPRSGLAVKNCIGVGAGVIDDDYGGEVEAVLFNQTRNLQSGFEQSAASATANVEASQAQ